MTDDNQRARVFDQAFFQNLQRLDIEVVGRFVEDQQVAGLREQSCEDDAVAFATGNRLDGRHRALRGKQEALEVANDMALLAVQHDVLAPVADHLGDGFLGVEVAAHLVEIANLEVGAELDRAGGGLEFAEHDFQQGALTDAVVADESDAVATHDLQRELLE